MGLKFTSIPPHVDHHNLKESLRRFDRNLRLREYFANSYSLFDSNSIKFHKKTKWTQPPYRDEALAMFLSVVKSELMNAHEHKVVPDLTANGQQA